MTAKSTQALARPDIPQDGGLVSTARENVLAIWTESRAGHITRMAAEGAQNLAVYPWQMIFPGLTMALMLFSLNFVGDGLRDALDPQMRKQ